MLQGPSSSTSEHAQLATTMLLSIAHVQHSAAHLEILVESVCIHINGSIQSRRAHIPPFQSNAINCQ